MKKVEPDEVLEGPGFSMARYGRFIRIDTNRTEEEHKQLLKALKEVHKSSPEIARKKSEQIITTAQKYDPLDIIANITFLNCSINPETYKEYSHEGSFAFAEYFALLCLKKPYWESEEFIIDGGDVESIQSSIREVFRNTIWFYGTESAESVSSEAQKGPPVEKEFRFKSILNELAVRNPGYRHHVIKTVRGIFSPMAGWMEKTLGFNIDDALAFEETYEAVIMGRFHERRDKSLEFMKQIEAEVHDYNTGRWKQAQLNEDSIRALASMRDSEAKESIRNMCIGWTFLRLGLTFSVTAEELAEHTSRPVEKAKSFLELFSLEFGSVDRDFYMPALTHDLKLKPFIHHGGRYILPSPILLLWALRPRIELILNPGSSEASNTDKVTWERYEKVRSEFLESESMQMLGQALRTSSVYRKLNYKVIEDGQGKEAELDGLAILDDALLLIECKAGALTPPARRGAPERMLRDVKKLIGDAHSQALRARKYIAGNEAAVFSLPDGNTLSLRGSDFDTMLLVTVNLDPLDVYTPVLYKVREWGLLEEGDLPWAVSFLDLIIICEVIEYPAELIHYLQRRIRVNDIGITTAHDELDLFGYYLHEGLFFEDIKSSGPDRFMLLSYTASFDDYYFYKEGVRETPAEKPRQQIPTQLRQILRDLDEQRPNGYVRASCALLDMSAADRESFSRNVIKCQNRALRFGSPSNFTMVYNETKTGITYACAKGLDRDFFHGELIAYGEKSKKEHSFDYWIILGSLLGRSGIVHIFSLIK